MKIKIKKANTYLKVLFRNFKGIIIVVVAAFILSLSATWCMKKFPVYVSDNKPNYNQETDITTNLNECNFCYYLDCSPSMFGLFGEPESNMYKLSNALEGIIGQNTIFSTEKIYICGQDINMDYDAEAFLGFMRNSSVNYDVESKTGKLSDIFTKSSGTNYNDENAVNMIITDLNFFPDENGLNRHKKLINNFAKQLVSHLGKSNICIYNLQSDFKGRMNTDEFDPLWDVNEETDTNHSFFIIVLSGDKFYDTFINRLEDSMGSQNIDFSEHKFELKNNMFNNHEISFDKSVLTEEDKVSEILQSLNLDNLSIGGIPDNAVGLGLSYAEDDKASSIKNLPVEKMELPGIYLNEDNKNKTSKVKTDIKLYYRSGPFAYKEYTGNDFITKQQAVIKLDESAKAYWLYLNLDFNKHAELPEAYGRESILADIRLQMEEPQFTIPQWVLSMNTNELDNSWSKKVAIKQLFEKLINAKMKDYEQNTTEYQRWMGNFLVYTSY